jgi:uncharacterized protein (TIGR02453 family)
MSTRFAGFGPDAIGFLKGLAFHQDRGWFEAHRDLYLRDVRGPLEALVSDLSAELASRGVSLSGMPKGAIFRIQRDVRFAKDKSPYQGHVSAAFTATGHRRDAEGGVLYVHVQPEGSFVAAGFWQPEAQALDQLRRALVGRPGRLREVEARLAEHGLALSSEDDLVRMPRGYERWKDEPDLAAALRRRSLVTTRPIPEAALYRPKLVAQLADFAVQAMPILTFGRAVLGGEAMQTRQAAPSGTRTRQGKDAR